MRDFSTQSARPDLEREELEFDVLFVGGGPACLAGLWRLLDLVEAHNARPGAVRLEGLTIGLIDKADELGEHAFSGAVLDPRALQELCPDYADRGFPIEATVQHEELWSLTGRGGLRLPFVPPFLHNAGFPVVSLAKMVRWMAQEIEKREIPGVDVMLLPGFAGINVLWEGTRVVGVQTADKGVAADGSPRPNLEPGNRLKARVTVFGEGPRGHLMRELEEVLHLQAGAVNPQVYETGVKEVWELPAGRVPPGFVLHSTGWPQAKGESGGSFAYGLSGDRLAIGYVVSMDTGDPFADAHRMLQLFKTHPRVAPLLEGGRAVQYGAKSLAAGGWHSLPKLAFDGGVVVGDSAQQLDAARLKGIHLGMKGGMCAAEAVLEALLKDNPGESVLGAYEQAFRASWAGEELKRHRNVHQSLAHGLGPAAALRIGTALATGGWVPCDPLKSRPDAACTETTEARYGKRGLKPADLDPGFKPDGARLLAKLDDVYLSGAMHDEHQPGHLKIVRGHEVCAACWEDFGSPCTVFCPAQVYEMHPDAAGKVEWVHIAYSNCVHCKTCDIKCPCGNVVWTPPEGGGGPKYTLC